MSNNYYVDWSATTGDDINQQIPGKSQIVVTQKTVDDTSTSLVLTGKGLPNYGQIQQVNFLKLLENFASSTVPLFPTIGQLWFNTGAGGDEVLYMHIHYEQGVFDEAPEKPKYFFTPPATIDIPAPATTAWVQVWPESQTFAGLKEYNAMASRINTSLSLSGTARLPIYTSMSVLAPGFTATDFPAQFDNVAWTNLLAKLRAILVSKTLSTDRVSPVGFINDGRPFQPVGGLAAGWAVNGQTVSDATMQIYYANTLYALASATT